MKKGLGDAALRRLREAVEAPDLTGSRYTALRRLAQGGMGTVYVARDRELDREVALKVLRDLDAPRSAALRMIAEAKIIAGLEHPGIVPVHDVGVLPDGRVFYVMKLVRGVRLSDRAGPSSPLAERLRLFEKICDASAFAHAHGVVHRDLKPENVMVGPFGEVLVMDWGIAKRTDRGDTHAGSTEADDAGAPLEWPANLPAPLTASGAVLGTLAYMAPEQLLGQSDRIDARTDVYALGGILFYLLTGRPPSDAASLEQAHAELKTTPPRSPRRYDRGVSRALDAVCLKAMARAPEDRYPSAEALAADVSCLLQGEPPGAYREGLLERALRLASRYRTAILLVLAYMVMRVVLILFFGR